ncbi:hypothetical protein LC593_02015 [Nostoc sp. CHAB 5844]|nr:hypothetical protein [Nostoc sp. CHAB 5844]
MKTTVFVLYLVCCLAIGYFGIQKQPKATVLAGAGLFQKKEHSMTSPPAIGRKGED